MTSRRQPKTLLEALPLRALTVRATPAVLALVALSLMVAHRAETLPVEKLRTTVTDFTAPLMLAVTQPFADAAESFEGFTTMRELKAENIRLREENAKLQKWYDSALRLQAENQSLRELLNVKADPSLSYATARVMSDPGGAFVKSVLLPVGTSDGVGKGNAVMSGSGLVGRVTEAGARSSRVLLVNDLNSRIPVMIQNTRTRAILAGKNTDVMRLERLPADSGIAVGQRVVTSGDGGQLPADIPVGIIVETGKGGVMVRPLADLDGLRHVQIIRTDIDPALVTGELVPAK